MSQHQHSQHESLSALLDGECTELELRRLLKQLDSDPALRSQYDNLNRTRAAMHVESAAWAGCDISLRVREAVTAAPFTPSLWQRAWRPVANVAITASVAVVVVMGAAYLPGSSEGVPETHAAAPSFAVVGNSGLTRTVSTAPAQRQAVQTAPAAVAAVATTADLDRFESYVQRHAEYASFNSNSGLMPFARVASFQRGE